jgi:aromatic ring-opening dioxygenase catalytic subunit (LigB family)
MFLRRLWIASVPLLYLHSRAAEFFPALNLLPSSPLQQTFRLSSTLSSNMTKGSVISLSHGGGPMPLIGDPTHKDIVKSLKERVPKILRLGTHEAPRAIIVITAHWSERNPTISNASKHPLYYDYYGFPPETYNLKYDAQGSPAIAQEVFSALESEGLQPEMDEKRGTLSHYD